MKSKSLLSHLRLITADESSHTYHPLGALLFSNATYTEALKVINESGVQAIPFVTGQRWLYNETTGVTVQSPSISAAFAALVGQEFQRYVAYWTTVFAPYSTIGYKVLYVTLILCY